MKWFKHESNAHNDAKLGKLRIRYGAEGYGIYWYCLELIAGSVSNHNLTFELEHDAEIISKDFDLHEDHVAEMMRYMCDLGLFEVGDGGMITCLKMALRLDQSATSIPVFRKAISDLKKSDHLRSIKKSDKKRAEDQRKDISPNSSFGDFWNAYPRKENKKRAESAFKRLSKDDQKKAMADCQTRFNGTEKQFIPMPSTYIKGERWNDEVTVNESGWGVEL